MNAENFMNEFHRMCESYCDNDCIGCKLHGRNCDRDLHEINQEFFNEVYYTTEKWSNEHPQETRQTQFLKEFPNMKLTDEGDVFLAPCILDVKFKSIYCDKANRCDECRHNYWSTPVESED